MTIEHRLAREEARMNAVLDEYFEARPYIPRTAAVERIFEAGFRSALRTLSEPQGKGHGRNSRM